nr:hypothetical protein [Tanacetum cinerariifolium]
MEDTMLELVKICQEKEFLCIHDDVDDLIQSALNSKLLLISSNSQRLDKKEQEVKNVAEQPVERGNRNIQSLQNFRVVHKREDIPVMMNDKDEDIDYSSFIFVMFDKVFSLLSVESEDTIFDPGISD